MPKVTVCDRAGVDGHSTVGDMTRDPARAKAIQSRKRVVARWAEPVELGQPGEVAGEGSEAGDESLHELAFVAN